MQKAWLKPADGLLVRYEQPERGHVPPEGAEVTMSKYYRRRIADGDLTRGRKPAKPAGSKEKS